MTWEDTAPTLYLVAGDVSGDQNCGRLAAAIRRQAPEVRLLGAGGAAMREAGVQVGVETTHLSIVGIPGPRLVTTTFQRYRAVMNEIDAARPDAVVLVDNEWTNLVLAMLLRRRRIPVVFFFPPQVWLWGRWRLPTIVPLGRRVLSAFRPEAELYRAAGADTVWIGHPLRDVVRVTEDPAQALRNIGLDPERPVVGLMPGSRVNEVRALVVPMLTAARELRQRDPRLQFALPLASEGLREEIMGAVAAAGVDVAVYRPRSYAVLSRARVVLQCSGTATLEVGLLGVPAVIAYRCTRLEYAIGTRFIDVPYIGMPNILLGDMVQPELFYRHVDAPHLAAEAWSLLQDETRRRAIQTRLAALRDLLGPPGAFARAAESVLDILPEAELVPARLAVARTG